MGRDLNWEQLRQCSAFSLSPQPLQFVGPVFPPLFPLLHAAGWWRKAMGSHVAFRPRLWTHPTHFCRHWVVGWVTDSHLWEYSVREIVTVHCLVRTTIVDFPFQPHPSHHNSGIGSLMMPGAYLISSLGV